MQKALILVAVLLLLPACATIEPDDGRHYAPPTFHWHPYQPKQVEKSTSFDTVYSSDLTVKMDR